jgi:cytochrome c biogenesis factor
VTIGVQVGTMVMWLWVGGLIMVMGTAVALVPSRRRRPREPDTVGAPPEDDQPAPLVGVTA